MITQADIRRMYSFFNDFIRKFDNYKVECEIYDAKDENKKVKNRYPEIKGISKEVYESVKNGNLVDIKDIKNVNDFKFNKLAWVFDMSFKRTFEIVEENKYIDRIFKNIAEPTEEMIELYEIIKEFVYKKLK